MCLAMPARILSVSHTMETDVPPSISGQNLEARIDYGGLIKTVDLSFVPEAKVGQYVLVHAGFAISVLDESEAQASLREFSQWQEETQS